MLKFKFTEDQTESYKRWISFYPKQQKGVGFNFTVDNVGYFDPRPQINTNVTSLVALVLPFVSVWLLPVSLLFCFWSWGMLYIHLPWDTGRNMTPGDKTFGITFYHVDSGFPDHIWLRGINSCYNTLYFPWNYKFVKKEILLKKGWYTLSEEDDIWGDTLWGDEILYETYPYKYVLKSGEEQNVNAITHEARHTWKRWFGLDKKVRHTVEIKFEKEIGEGTGSWKGGVVGCRYEFLPGESRSDVLKRMERERKFR